MKTAYLDSNVILSKYFTTDPYHLQCCQILEGNLVRCVSSTLTIIEIAAVVSKQYLNISFIEKSDDIDSALDALAVNERIEAVIKYILTEEEIEYFSHLGSEKLRLNNKGIRLFSDYSRAFIYAPFFQLKTLDLLHVSSLKNILIEGDVPIDYLVTGDQDILKKKKEIQSELDVTVIDPDTLTSIL